MTILRKAEHTALSKETLKGSVIDLGGHKNSEYVRYLNGTFTRTTANLSDDADIRCDFEKPLPMKDATYDNAILINVLEHIYEYRQLLKETARILKRDGTILVIVPYLFPYHPSPRDFHRFSGEALERALTDAGFTDIIVTPLGTGLFQSQYLMVERLLPSFLHPLSIVFGPLQGLCDHMFTSIARALGKKYQPSDYALGFKVSATKVSV